MKKPVSSQLGCILAVLLSTSAGAYAQQPDAFRKQQRMFEQMFVLQQRVPQVPLNRRLLLEAGGWYTWSLQMFDLPFDGRNLRVLRRNDVRLWGRLNFDNVIRAYGRLLMTHYDFNHGDGFSHGDDFKGPDLQYGWVNVDVTEAFRKYLPTLDMKLPVDFDVTVGRQYVEYGSGLALSMPLDAIQFHCRWQQINLRALLAKTIHSTDDIDRSLPDPDHSDRHFYGFELSYDGFSNHRPFFYIIWQNDRNNARTVLQDYDYDSIYYGLGSRGRLFLPDLRYNFEWVFQGGESYGHGATTNRDDIEAYAMDIELDYRFRKLPCAPQLEVQYLMASGDSDRTYSPVSTVGGNRAGTKDRSYNAFGYRNLGISFAPRLSNLHVWRVGLNARPFQHHSNRLLKHIELGSDFFFYHKYRRTGALSDISSSETTSTNAGQEWDVWANWRILSDVALTLRYGVFWPGEALRDRSERQYFFVGVTYSF